MKIKVKIKPEIAAKGSGFYDPDKKQNIYPPRDKDRNPKVGHIFTLESTPSIEKRISNGELILIERIGVKEKEENSTDTGKSVSEIKVIINEKEVTKIKASLEEMPDDQLEELVYNNQKVIKTVGRKGIEKADFDRDSLTFNITTKK